MISIEEIKLYLPKYLSPESEKDLFDQLKTFPDNIDTRLYTRYVNDDNVIYQGDGLDGMLFVNLPDSHIAKVPSVILSNSCDIHPDNVRYLSPSIIYSPILNLGKYEARLIEKGIEKSRVTNHIDMIRKQKITSIFYLPRGGSLDSESMVSLDSINTCDINYIDKDKIKSMKIFTLSNYGHYLFLFKLSIHFTRVTEGFDRDRMIGWSSLIH